MNKKNRAVCLRSAAFLFSGLDILLYIWYIGLVNTIHNCRCNYLCGVSDIVVRKLIVPEMNRKLLLLRKKLRKFVQLVENRYKYKIFITLTFDSDVSDSEASTRLKNYFQWLRDNGYKYKYFWVKERTKNGRIQYHVILFSDTFIPKPDCSGWSSGMSNIQLIKKGVYRYVSKYLPKQSIPGRMYGYSRGILNEYNKIPLWLWDKSNDAG